MREHIDIRYDKSGDLFIEVPNLLSDKLSPIYDSIRELLGSDIQVEITNGLDIQKILYKESENFGNTNFQSRKMNSLQSHKAQSDTHPNDRINDNINIDRSNSLISTSKQHQTSPVSSFDFSGEDQIETASEVNSGSDTASSNFTLSRVGDYISQGSTRSVKVNNRPELRHKILRGMKGRRGSRLSTRVWIIVKMRWKFLYANAVELTTIIIVTGITTLCGCYVFVVADNIFPLMKLDDLMFYTVFIIVITEGYNNILYSYHMVYENSLSIKKLLVCNGLRIHEYYLGNLLADYLINLLIQGPLLLCLVITMKMLILESAINNMQIALFCLTLFMWKLSFIVTNYFYSFIFVRTSFVTRNFCVLYLALSSICLVLSRYIPVIFYFNDFVFCLSIFQDFHLIENRVVEIICVPLFQIVFFFVLIQIYEHHSITHNYLVSYRSSSKLSKDSPNENQPLNNGTNKNNNDTNDQDLNPNWETDDPENPNINRNKIAQNPEFQKERKPKRQKKKLNVRIRNLKKIYSGTKPSLNLSNLKLKRKDCIGLIGPNGAGKSTFFNVLISEIKKSGDMIIF